MDSSGNSQKLGNFVAEAMESLEESFPNAVLGDIMLICELNICDDEGPSTTTRYICTDARNHVQIGLLRVALMAAEK